MKQLHIIPAGCQIWNKSVCGFGGGRFAYCSSLAIYVYSLDTFQLERVIHAHHKNITSLTWCTMSPNIVATCAHDKTIRVWNLDTGLQIGDMSTELHDPVVLEWNPFHPSCFASASVKGVIRIWDYPTRMFGAANFDIDAPLRVLRWHPRRQNLLAGGFEDGSVVTMDSSILKRGTLFRSAVLDSRTDVDSGNCKVEDIQWDPLSDTYILIAFSSGHVVLFDISSGSEIKHFERIAGGIQSLAWIPSEPGNFFSADKRTGVLRYWNVSQKSAIDAFKLANSAFQNTVYDDKHNSMLCTFSDGSIGLYNTRRRRYDYRSEAGHTETIFDCRFSPSNPDTLLTSSYDGSVKMWDIASMELVLEFVRVKAVIYSVSWCRGKPLVAGALSTNDVIIWDAVKGTQVGRHAVHKDAVFRVEWDPHPNASYNLLASCSKDGTCCVFRENGTLVRRYTHARPCFGIAWNFHQRDIIAVGCFDGVVRIYDINAQTDSAVRELRGHTDAVYNVEYHPLVPGVLVSGSNDHSVRVWNVADGSCVCLVGHVDNVRALCWHHEIPWILLSGSWDGTIRCWNVADRKCVSMTHEHHSDVYGLDSHAKRPFVFASTSRDTTTRFFQLSAMAEALKFGLSTMFPIKSEADLVAMFTSTQRTVFNGISSDMNILGDVVPPQMKMSGSNSLDLIKTLKTSAGTDSNLATKFKTILEFFDLPFGTRDLMELLESTTSRIARSSKAEVLHVNEVGPTLEARGRELVQQKNVLSSVLSRSLKVSLADRKRETRLRAAAKMFLCAGNIPEFCKICIECGDWHSALMIAPGHSMQLWSDLMRRYAEYVLEHPTHQEPFDPSLFLAASGHVPQAVSLLRQRGDFDDAFTISVSDMLGRFPFAAAQGQNSPSSSAAGPSFDSSATSDISSPKVVDAVEAPNSSSLKREASLNSIPAAVIEKSYDSISPLVLSVVTDSSDFEKHRYQPIWAASYRLSVDDVHGATELLHNANELFLSWAVANCTLRKGSYPLRLIQDISARCLMLNLYVTAYALHDTVPNGRFLTEFMCVRYTTIAPGSTVPEDPSAIWEVYRSFGLRSSGNYLDEERSATRTMDRVRCLMLGRQFTDAGVLIDQKITQLFSGFLKSSDGIFVPDITEVGKYAVFLDNLDLTAIDPPLRARLLCYSYFLGAVKASQMGWWEICAFLSAAFRQCLFHGCGSDPHSSADFTHLSAFLSTFPVPAILDFPISLSEVAFLEARALLYAGNPEGLVCLRSMAQCGSITEEYKVAIGGVLEAAKSPELLKVLHLRRRRNVVKTAGCSVPGRTWDGFAKHSAISGQEIVGSILWLTSKQPVSMAEALQYRRCCAFHPNASGIWFPPPFF
eukprot:ANDGO_04516.mRNA.1 putative WD repeat-containing protein alr2800